MGRNNERNDYEPQALDPTAPEKLSLSAYLHRHAVAALATRGGAVKRSAVVTEGDKADAARRAALGPLVNVSGNAQLRGNCHVKVFPDGHMIVKASDRQIFRVPGWTRADYDRDPERPALPDREAVEKSQYQLEREDADAAARKAASSARAKRRAKAAVADLCLANKFRYFVTLTLSPEKVDRYDAREVTRRLNHWLDNHVRRNGLAYVLVAERHKDGAIHFHGFFNDALPVVDSGHVDRRGHRVFNLPAWELGFTTAVELYGDFRAAVGYCVKYITKAQEKIGGRWYYSGGNLARPSVHVCNADFEQLCDFEGAYVSEVPGLGAKLVTLDGEGGVENGDHQQPGGALDDVQRGQHDAWRGSVPGDCVQVPERGAAVSGNGSDGARNGPVVAGDECPSTPVSGADSFGRWADAFGARPQSAETHGADAGGCGG